jgi:hypothetical protein
MEDKTRNRPVMVLQGVDWVTDRAGCEEDSPHQNGRILASFDGNVYKINEA